MKTKMTVIRAIMFIMALLGGYSAQAAVNYANGHPVTTTLVILKTQTVTDCFVTREVSGYGGTYVDYFSGSQLIHEGNEEFSVTLAQNASVSYNDEESITNEWWTFIDPENFTYRWTVNQTTYQILEINPHGGVGEPPANEPPPEEPPPGAEPIPVLGFTSWNGSTVHATETGRLVAGVNPNPGTSSYFKYVDLNGGNIESGDYLQLKCNGLWVTPQGDSALYASDATAGSAQQVMIIKLSGSSGNTIVSGDQVALQASNGLHWCAEDGGGREITPSRPWVNGWEIFTFWRALISGF